MSRVKVRFDKIYLVSHDENIHGEYRVTRRTGVARPKTVKFSGLQIGSDSTPMGTLVLNQDLWETWFPGDVEFMPGMETAERAAETLVKRNRNISYGCPLCSATFQTLVGAQQHAEQHMAKILSQFEVDVLQPTGNICPFCGKSYLSTGPFKKHLIECALNAGGAD